MERKIFSQTSSPHSFIWITIIWLFVYHQLIVLLDMIDLIEYDMPKSLRSLLITSWNNHKSTLWSTKLDYVSHSWLSQSTLKLSIRFAYTTYDYHTQLKILLQNFFSRLYRSTYKPFVCFEFIIFNFHSWLKNFLFVSCQNQEFKWLCGFMSLLYVIISWLFIKPQLVLTLVVSSVKFYDSSNWLNSFHKSRFTQIWGFALSRCSHDCYYCLS